MTTIVMTPGAMVIASPKHQGLERMAAFGRLVARGVAVATSALDTWRQARIAAHDDATRVESAAHERRLVAELRTAHLRGDR